MAASTLRRTANATLASISNLSTQLTTSVVHLPQTYANYIASNSSTPSQIENALRSLTFLLPGARLHDSELAYESVHAFVHLLSIYHDSLLKNRASLIDASPTLSRSAPVSKFKPKPTPHGRYTTFWSNSSSLYTKIATLLKMAQYTELLWEMLARRRGGERMRWRVVVVLETFKAVCRLILMRLTNSRPLVTPPMPLREDFAPPQPESETREEFSQEELKMAEGQDIFNPRDVLGELGVLTPPRSEPGKVSSGSTLSLTDPFSMPRTGLTLPTLPSPDAVSAYLFSRVITPDDVKPAKQLLHRLTSIQGQVAEVLHILRPVIYALLMQRVARQYGYEGTKWKRNWAPWLAGLTIEYMSRQIAKQDLTARVPGGARSGLSGLERDELKKRGWNMAWWGMRGAFYENVTKKWVHSVVDKLKGKPLLDLVGGIIEDYDYLYETYHFSSATM